MAAQDYYTDPAIEVARAKAETSANTASQYQGAASLYPYKLREAINEKLDYNKDLIEQKNRAMENAFAAPSEARVQYQDIFNPFQREALVSRATAQAYTPYQNLSDILGQRMGSIANIVGAGTAGFNADVTAKQNAAALDRQSYEDQLGLAKLMADAALEEAKANGSGGGGSMSDIEKTIMMLAAMSGQGNIGGGQPQPTEPKPTVSPRYAPQGTNLHSPEGQWQYNWTTKDWEPIGGSSDGFVEDSSSGGGDIESFYNSLFNNGL